MGKLHSGEALYVALGVSENVYGSLKVEMYMLS